MMRLYAIPLFAIALAGCQTGGIGRPGSPAWQLSTTEEQKLAYFRSTCEAYGFKEGTPQMAQCMQNEASSTRAAASQRAASLQAYNTMSRPKTVTCNTFGNITRCNSF